MEKTGGNTITLLDGRVLTVDLSKITLREYRALWDQNVDPSRDDVVFAKALCISLDELLDLSLLEAAQVKLQVLLFARSPLEFPNSQSVSTSP